MSNNIDELMQKISSKKKKGFTRTPYRPWDVEGDGGSDAPKIGPEDMPSKEEPPVTSSLHDDSPKSEKVFSKTSSKTKEIVPQGEIESKAATCPIIPGPEPSLKAEQPIHTQIEDPKPLVQGGIDDSPALRELDRVDGLQRIILMYVYEKFKEGGRNNPVKVQRDTIAKDRRISSNSIRELVSRLVKKQLLVRNKGKPGPGGSYYSFSLPDEVIRHLDAMDNSSRSGE